MKENNEENLNEITELDENVEMVELDENEENDVEGGASASGWDKGYTALYLDFGNIVWDDAYLLISGLSVKVNQFVNIGGFFFSWMRSNEGMKIMIQNANKGSRIRLSFWAKRNKKDLLKTKLREWELSCDYRGIISLNKC